jgi:hypothetical protein
MGWEGGEGLELATTAAAAVAITNRYCTVHPQQLPGTILASLEQQWHTVQVGIIYSTTIH